MSPTGIGIIVFTCTFAGVLLGMWIRARLPEHAFDAESRDAVKVGIGLIATMTALVLGLVTASAKSSFDSVNAAMKQSAVQLLVLDRVLARYGPETGEIRGDLQQLVGTRIDMIWPQGSSRPTHPGPLRSEGSSGPEGIADAIGDLKPHDDSQRALQSRARDLAETLLQGGWLLLIAGTGASVPVPFLVVLLFWLTITFASFGLSAPRKPMVIIVLFICALSVASAVFLVLELDGPFDGLLKVSPDALRSAYAHLNH
jgi:hypothetical protein